jgi:hypothetical protein
LNRKGVWRGRRVARGVDAVRGICDLLCGGGAEQEVCVVPVGLFGTKNGRVSHSPPKNQSRVIQKQLGHSATDKVSKRSTRRPLPCHQDVIVPSIISSVERCVRSTMIRQPARCPASPRHRGLSLCLSHRRTHVDDPGSVLCFACLPTCQFARAVSASLGSATRPGSVICLALATIHRNLPLQDRKAS